jgi:hypothetical protein
VQATRTLAVRVSHAAAAFQVAVQCGQFTDLNFKQGMAVCLSGVKHVRELTKVTSITYSNTRWVVYITWENAGRNSAFGIANRYGLDSQGIKCRWGRDFPQLSRPVLGPTQPPMQWVPGLSGG